MLDVHLLYFAALREQRGASEEVVQVAAGTTVGELYRQLFGGDAMRVAFAVNQGTVVDGHPLSAGDEVVFLPPLGGG
jgi:sulfur-carrier protein